MIAISYICNGCGQYSIYGKERPLNVITVDMTNYLIFNSVFLLKEPRLDIHFCSSCYSNVIDGCVRVRQMGDIEVMREKIKSLEEALEKEKLDFEKYKNKTKEILKNQ